MARKLQTNPLDGRTARASLPAKAGGEPHWLRLQRKPALYLGWRKVSGAWIARWRLGGKYREQVIGTADDTREADGLGVLSFDQAQGKARQLLERELNPAPATSSAESQERQQPMTVREALAAYVANLRAANGDAEANRSEGRFLNHVLPFMGAKRIIDLTTADILAVRNRMVRHADDDPDVERASKSSANRTMAQVKAALNAVFQEPKNNIPHDGAWRRCKRFRDVEAARELHLDDDQIRQLVNACRADLRNLVLAGILTGCRPGKELRIMRCRDFSAQVGVVQVPDGKTGTRPITLTREGVEFFSALTAGRSPDDLIFKNRHGKAWALDGHVRPFKEAVRRAGLPADACAYNLRHCYISTCIMNGMPADLIARNCGTSMEQIAKHYSKWFAKRRQEMVEAAAPRLGLVGGNVTALKIA